MAATSAFVIGISGNAVGYFNECERTGAVESAEFGESEDAAGRSRSGVSSCAGDGGNRGAPSFVRRIDH